MHDVIVIGGGISGLATAHDLMERGLDVQLLERQVRTGGNAISERFDGFLMEHGPTTFNAAVPEAVEQITALGLLDHAHDLGPNVKNRYLRDEGKLTGISAQPMGFFKSDYLSLKGRLRIFLEALVPRYKSDNEETIHAFVARRFGREFADKVMEPMAAGIFMGDSKQLSLSGAFPKLAEMEQTLGSITRGVLRAKRGSEPGRHLYSWDAGIGTIPQRFSHVLGARVHTGITVTQLSKTADGFRVKTSHGTRTARSVVLAVQPHVAANLLENIDPVGASATAEITAPSVNVAFFGYRREQVQHPLDGLGFLSTKDSSRILSGAQFASTMYPGRAPAGFVSISAYAGGVRNPELTTMSNADLTAQMHNELAEMLGIKGAPVVAKLRRWSLGLPQYTLGHAARQHLFLQTPERVDGLFVTGNYTGGVSVANCLKSAKLTAQTVAAQLPTSRLASNVTMLGH